jgi:hypothetical protein
MEAEMDLPVQVNDVLNVSTITKPKDSVYIYDLHKIFPVLLS